MLISMSDILSKSWHLYKSHFKQLLPYLLLTLVPAVFLAFFAVGTLFIQSFLPASPLVNLFLLAVIILLLVVLSFWISTALIKAIGDSANNQPILPWKQGLAFVLPRLWHLFLATALVSLIIVGIFLIPVALYILVNVFLSGNIPLLISIIAFVALLAVAVLVSMWYAFVYYEVIFDNKSPVAALRDSKALVKGRWWSIFFHLLVPALVFGLLGFALRFVVMLLASAIPNELVSGISELVFSTVVNLLISPLTIYAGLLVYFSAKQTPVTAQPTTPAVA